MAEGVSLAGFTRRVLEEAVKPTEGARVKPKKSGYGLLAKYGPGRSEEEIDENRRRRSVIGGVADIVDMRSEYDEEMEILTDGGWSGDDLARKLIATIPGMLRPVRH